jgi:glycosyltransferase involved in cell wall biosynthesis
MHYAVPRIIHEGGMLQSFFTDVSALHKPFSLLDKIPRRFRSGSLNRLISRRPEGLPKERVHAAPLLGFEYSRRQSAARTAQETVNTYIWMGKRFGETVLKRAGEEWNAAYVFNSAGSAILDSCRRNGKFGILEQCSAPRLRQIAWTREEMASHPEWGATSETCPADEDYAEIEKREWAAATRIVCPSGFVRTALLEEGVPSEKVFVVPYGVDMPLRNTSISPRKPGPLRVLVAGKVCLQKGARYVYEAAKLLQASVQVRMVGSLSGLPQALLSTLSNRLELVGTVPRPAMTEQYSWADVFLLPSLCEGSATVVYEAMAHGLPVICTPNTGSVVREGVDGFIVPICDAGAIATRLEQLSEDPGLRERMGANARERAAEFTVTAYGRRLLAAIS